MWIHCGFQDIDYEGFKLFVDTYLEVDIPDELCRHLFLSFLKRPSARPPGSPLPTSNSVPQDGRAIKVIFQVYPHSPS